ncbi:TPA: CapA family protein [Streptococcus suis]|nr:CapA family protein [Streptococcus suis]HEL1583851.1 CapA family protein [Streptococcus suis]
MKRRRNRVGRRHKKRQPQWLYIFASTLLVIGMTLFVLSWLRQAGSQHQASLTSSSTDSGTSTSSSEASVQTARIMAHGDLLYHDLLYMSAEQPDGSYNFSENFTYVKPWIEQADLAIADFEGTISPDYPLAGYQLFNAPASVATAMAEAGYDVVDLAHNHILDSQLSGLISTVSTFKQVGIDSIGVYAEGNRSTAPLYIREVNGIKIAILGYAYGFNGMEGNLTQEEYDAYLSDFMKEKMRSEIERAEQEADFTIVMPQAGVEYQLDPTEEQVTLYHEMVEWGADMVLGGHPHVAEPAEIVEKDGQRKLIIYSMGNFLSNQRIETMEGVANAQWTERGMLMDITLEKKNGVTTIQTAQAQPTWVSKISKGTYSKEGHEQFTYQTLILADFIEGGAHRNQIDQATQQRIDTAYQEMTAFMGLSW